MALKSSWLSPVTISFRSHEMLALRMASISLIHIKISVFVAMASKRKWSKVEIEEECFLDFDSEALELETTDDEY